jgi:hypothetical protein
MKKRNNMGKKDQYKEKEQSGESKGEIPVIYQ